MRRRQAELRETGRPLPDDRLAIPVDQRPALLDLRVREEAANAGGIAPVIDDEEFPRAAAVRLHRHVNGMAEVAERAGSRDTLIGACSHVVGDPSAFQVLGSKRPADSEQKRGRRRIDLEREGQHCHDGSPCWRPGPLSHGTAIRKPRKRCSRTSFEFRVWVGEGERHALHCRAQAGNPRAYHQERPPPVQPERL